MDVSKYKIQEADFKGKGVSAQPNPMQLPEEEAKAVFDQLVKEGRITAPKTFKEFTGTRILYSPKPNLSNVKTLDLKVVRSHILWRSFTKKSFIEDGKINYSVAKKDIKDVLKSLRGHGFKEGVIQFFASGYEFLDIFFYANFFPRIIKKYGLDLKEKKEQ